jgi:predicted dehydrogenase
MDTRFGIVGTAYWAANVHAAGLPQVPGARLAGIWGRDPGKAASLAASCGTEAFPSFDAMLANVDAVSFAVPPAVQEDLALPAIEAGKHVLLEKPIATSSAAASRLADAARRNRVGSLVFFTRRFVPEIAAAIETARSHAWREAHVAVVSGALLPGSPYVDSVWRQAEGAALWDVGPHILSLLVPVLGPVTRQRALTTGPGWSRFETTHAGGAVATCAVTLSAPPEARCNRYVFSDDTTRFVLPEPHLDHPAVYASAVGALLETVRSGHAHPLDVAFGAETVRVLEAIDATRTAPGH